MQVDQLQREYILVLPQIKSDVPAPVVFAFHGHGGTMRNSAKKFRIHELWPEAIVVYPQGLPTPGMTDPEGKKPGWQKTVGDQQDRDLNFFDAIREKLSKENAIDPNRVYSMGHSNGGGFTYLLSATRASTLAAIAPSSSGARGAMNNDSANSITTMPLFHAGATNDKVVPFEMQQKTIEAFIQRNQCSTASTPWQQVAKQYVSKTGKPVVTFVHENGHQYPDELPKLVVAFFKEHSLQTAK